MSVEVLIIGFVGAVIVFVVGVELAFKKHFRRLDKIDKLIQQVKKGESFTFIERIEKEMRGLKYEKC